MILVCEGSHLQQRGLLPIGFSKGGLISSPTDLAGRGAVTSCADNLHRSVQIFLFLFVNEERPLLVIRTCVWALFMEEWYHFCRHCTCRYLVSPLHSHGATSASSAVLCVS